MRCNESFAAKLAQRLSYFPVVCRQGRMYSWERPAVTVRPQRENLSMNGINSKKAEPRDGEKEEMNPDGIIQAPGSRFA